MRLFLRGGLQTAIAKPRRILLAPRTKALHLLLPIIRKQILILQQSERTIMEFLND